MTLFSQRPLRICCKTDCYWWSFLPSVPRWSISWHINKLGNRPKATGLKVFFYVMWTSTVLLDQSYFSRWKFEHIKIHELFLKKQHFPTFTICLISVLIPAVFRWDGYVTDDPVETGLHLSLAQRLISTEICTTNSLQSHEDQRLLQLGVTANHLPP